MDQVRSQRSGGSNHLREVLISLQRDLLHLGFDHGALPLLDVLLILLLRSRDLVVQHLEKQHLRGVLGFGEELHGVVKSRHLQLDLVVLDQRDAHFEKIQLALQEEVVPDSGQEGLREAVREDRQEPVDEVDLGVDEQGLEVSAHEWYVLLHQILEKHDPELDLHQVTLEEGQEVVPVHGVHERAEGLVLVVQLGEHLSDLKQVANQADVGADHSQDLHQLHRLFRVRESLDLGEGSLLFTVELIQGGSEAQGVADDDRPQSCPAGLRQSKLPQSAQQRRLQREESRVLLDVVDLLVGAATAEPLEHIVDYLVLHHLGSLQLVVPMLIPVGEDLGIPLVLDLLLAEVKLELRLDLNPPVLSVLDQQSSNVVDPLCPGLGISGLQVQAPLPGDDREAHRVEHRGHLVGPHHLRCAPQGQIDDISHPDAPVLLERLVGVYPSNLLLVRRQEDLPLHRLHFARTELDEDVPPDEFHDRVEDLGQP